MPRMSNKKRLEMSFFINDKGRLEFNRQCRACLNACKQSFRVIVVFCPIYKPKRRR